MLGTVTLSIVYIKIKEFQKFCTKSLDNRLVQVYYLVVGRKRNETGDETMLTLTLSFVVTSAILYLIYDALLGNDDDECYAD